jgi:ComF family protein
MGVAENIIRSFSQLFFPHTCAGCGTDLVGKNQLICLQCMNQLPYTDFAGHRDNTVEKIFYGRVAIENAMSLLYFSKDSLLQDLLHQFKYKGKKEIGLFFGRMMGAAMMESGNYSEVDAIVPLPLFASREKKRGYNQAAILCYGIAEIMHIPVLTDAVHRISATETQTHKTRIERWQNISGKFALSRPEMLQNKHVLLVDDVLTTGATLEACAATMANSGNIKISIATLAYTLN